MLYDDRHCRTLYFDTSLGDWLLITVTGVQESKNFCARFLIEFAVDLD